MHKIKNTLKTHYKHYAKNLKRQLMMKDFLCKLKLHMGNWKACPQALRLSLNVWR